ncbi:unnamed protein product, partial [Didymodactylos carnosus]
KFDMPKTGRKILRAEPYLAQNLGSATANTCIDRYLISSPNVRKRQLSSKKLALQLTVVNASFWLLTANHTLILFDIKSGIYKQITDTYV